MNETLRWDFFVAHAGADKHVAEQLYDLLASRSHVFLDSRCLKLGDDWDTELAKAQRSSAISVILISAQTESAYYQREEIAAAIALARNDTEKHRVVPIFLSPESELGHSIPYGLRVKHGIRIQEQMEIQEAVGQLFALLQTVREATTSAFLFGNYLVQLASPNLPDRDRDQLVDAMKALPGLHNSWFVSITGVVHPNQVAELTDRLAPPQDGSSVSNALRLGVFQRSLEHALKHTEFCASLPKFTEQFQRTLNDLKPPPELEAEIMEMVNGAVANNNQAGIEDLIVPRIILWLRAKSRRSLT